MLRNTRGTSDRWGRRRAAATRRRRNAPTGGPRIRTPPSRCRHPRTRPPADHLLLAPRPTFRGATFPTRRPVCPTPRRHFTNLGHTSAGSSGPAGLNRGGEPRDDRPHPPTAQGHHRRRGVLHAGPAPSSRASPRGPVLERCTHHPGPDVGVRGAVDHRGAGGRDRGVGHHHPAAESPRDTAGRGRARRQRLAVALQFADHRRLGRQHGVHRRRHRTGRTAGALPAGDRHLGGVDHRRLAGTGPTDRVDRPLAEINAQLATYTASWRPPARTTGSAIRWARRIWRRRRR